MFVFLSFSQPKTWTISQLLIELGADVDAETDWKSEDPMKQFGTRQKMVGNRKKKFGIRTEKISARKFVLKISKWKREANTFAFCCNFKSFCITPNFVSFTVVEKEKEDEKPSKELLTAISVKPSYSIPSTSKVILDIC